MGMLTPSNGAEIKLLFPVTMVPAMKQLTPQFEEASGNRVETAFANIGALTARVQKGEVADVLIVSPAQIEDLIKAGRVRSGSETLIAQTPIVIIVKKGAPKPDISSLEAFKRTLQRAKSIAFNNPTSGGPVGVFAMALLEKLGLTAELTPN